MIWQKKKKKRLEDKTEQRGETRHRQLTLSERLVTVNGFSVAAEFQVGPFTRRKSAPSGGTTEPSRMIYQQSEARRWTSAPSAWSPLP